MSATNFGTLKAEIADKLHRTGSIADAVLGGFINDGLQRINDELLVFGGIPDQEDIAFADLTANNEFLGVPLDFGMLQWIKLDGSTSTPDDPLEIRPYDALIEFYGDCTGPPQKFCFMANQFCFRPIPDAAYRVRINYIARYPLLVSNSDTNYLITNGRNVLFYAAMMEATAYIQDDARLNLWGSAYKEAIKNLRLAASRERRHTAPELQVDRALLGSSRRNLLNGF